MPWGAIQSELDRWQLILTGAYFIALMMLFVRGRSMNEKAFSNRRGGGVRFFLGFVFGGRSDDRPTTILLWLTRGLLLLFVVIVILQSIAIYREPECLRMGVAC